MKQSAEADLPPTPKPVAVEGGAADAAGATTGATTTAAALGIDLSRGAGGTAAGPNNEPPDAERLAIEEAAKADAERPAAEGAADPGLPEPLSAASALAADLRGLAESLAAHGVSAEDIRAFDLTTRSVITHDGRLLRQDGDAVTERRVSMQTFGDAEAALHAALTSPAVQAAARAVGAGLAEIGGIAARGLADLGRALNVRLDEVLAHNLDTGTIVTRDGRKLRLDR